MHKQSIFHQKAWSPYIAGVIIGSLQIPLFLCIHSSLGTSGSFGAVICFLRSLVGLLPDSKTCLPTLKPLLQLGIVMGIVIGAWVSSKLAGTRRPSIAPAWERFLHSRSVLKRLVLAFLGGFFLLMGARIASGCTSGNGISGLALQFVGSYIVIASMFLAGILVSAFYKKR